MYCRLGRRYGWHLSNLMEASVFASLSCSVWHREINWRRIGGHSSPPSFHPPSYLRASFKPKKATCQIVPSKFFIRLPLFSMLDAKQKAEEGMSKSLLNHVQSQHQKCKVPIAYFFLCWRALLNPLDNLKRFQWLAPFLTFQVWSFRLLLLVLHKSKFHLSSHHLSSFLGRGSSRSRARAYALATCTKKLL